MKSSSNCECAELHKGNQKGMMATIFVRTYYDER